MVRYQSTPNFFNGILVVAEAYVSHSWFEDKGEQKSYSPDQTYLMLASGKLAQQSRKSHEMATIDHSHFIKLGFEVELVTFACVSFAFVSYFKQHWP